jgi:hypothetical protein
MIAPNVSGQRDDDVDIALLRKPRGIEWFEYDAASIARHAQFIDQDSRCISHSRIMRQSLGAGKD